MKEKFREMSISGEINIKLSDTKGTWTANKKDILMAIISVCEEYKASGYSLTLRQLYYQLVSKDFIPNHDKVYKKLSSLKDDVVYSGFVDWKIFEDRGREPHTPYSEDGVSEALLRTVDYYRLERQKGQEVHVEVWTEKDAISSILKGITNQFGITLVVNKGYTSSTAIYGSYQRFCKKINDGGKVLVLYFGDHDPSGLDMIRDINDRILYMLSRGSSLKDERINEWWDKAGYNIYDVASMEGFEKVADIMDDDSQKLYDLFEEGKKRLYIEQNSLFGISQIGLTMEQIKQYNPPPNPAKITDPRAKKYIAEFGQVSWEVDALKPSIMEDIVENAIEKAIDMDVYNEVIEEENNDKETITKIVDSLNK